MKYSIYKLSFLSGVHFGKNDLSKSENTFMADTLFSALCQEAVKVGDGCLQQLYDGVQDGRLKFSDAFPYVEDTYFLPKPVKRIETEDEGDSGMKNAVKKLAYIPADKLSDYIKGKLDIMAAGAILSELGEYGVTVSAAVRGREETVPYHIQYFKFKEKCGLYIMLAYEEDADRELFENLMEGISYSGIGGRRSSGHGKFQYIHAKMPEYILRRLENGDNECMTLSVSLPKEEELEEALENASYVLVKRSGFIDSDSYNGNPRRKKDIFMMKSGSCFCNKYMGKVYDVSSVDAHSVFKYGIPLWMGVTE